MCDKELHKELGDGMERVQFSCFALQGGKTCICVTENIKWGSQNNAKIIQMNFFCDCLETFYITIIFCNYWHFTLTNSV